MAHTLREIRRENDRKGVSTLTLMGGDLLTGTVFSSVWKGTVGVELMNQIGFDAMVVGNHEFDYGADHLLNTLAPKMGFPLLSANINDRSGRAVFKEAIEIRPPHAPGRIVILGLTTAHTPTATLPKNVAGLTFKDPIETAQAFTAACRDEDLMVALTHLGVTEDTRLAASAPNLDLIVGGHSHTALFAPLKAGRTLVVQAGAYSMYVGRLDLTVSNGRITDYKNRLIPMSESVQEAHDIAEIIAGYRSKLDQRLNEVVGTAHVRLEGTRSAVRSGETTNLGALVCYAMASQVRAKAAMVNGGAIRDGFSPGEITIYQVQAALPFADQVVKLGLRGADLNSVLERSDSLEPGSGGKLQTFGVKFIKRAGKFTIERIGDEPYSPDRIYRIATNDFLAQGGDGYAILRDRAVDRYESGVSLSDSLVELFRRERTITGAFLRNLLE
jgi:2',3'-cyclic-nucleotide 2'-phosphodiesterase (5'-nucleotidase family)